MSQPDRELLEFAAKAAGITGGWGDQFLVGDSHVDLTDMFFIETDGSYWNPLTDDGDALRLAVHLALFNGSQMFHFRSLERFGNPQATELECTRRAIVRAAAEIGRAMP